MTLKSMAKKKLENLSLTDWTAWHDYSGKCHVKENEVDIAGLPLETFFDDNQIDDEVDRKLTFQTTKLLIFLCLR